MALQYSDIRTSPVPLPIGKELQEVTTAELPSELSELGSEERSVAPVITMKSDQVEEILLQKHLGQTLLSRPNHTLRGFSLKGNVCVVTGGASGIGLEICRFLLESGGRVAIVDLNVGAAERQAKLLTQSFDSEDENNLSPLVTAHFVDVSSPTSIDLAVTSILRAHGRIDNLVTSAGICENYSAITYPHSRMQKMWSINVDGSFYFATTVAKHLIERKVGGSFVFIGSMSGSVVNVPQLQTPYNMSKAAVRQMARSLAVEWAELGIRVNCVSPGYIKTALTEEIMRNEPALYEEWVARTPVKRLGQPADIAGAVVFLLSEMSSYMTGSEMVIDGGYTLI